METRRIIKNLIRAIEKNRNDILIAGIVGSRASRESIRDTSDLDVVVIFKNPPRRDPSNSQKLISLKKSLNVFIKEERKTPLQIVPTFRVEELVRAIHGNRVFIIHLLTYSSLRIFERYENPSVIRGFAETIKVKIGNPSRLDVIKRRRLPSFEKRIGYILQILQETYFFMSRGACNDRLQKEFVEKLRFVVRFTCMEFFVERGVPFSDALKWRYLLDHRRELPAGGSLLVKVFNLGECRIAQQELEDLYRKAFQFINIFLKMKKIVRKKKERRT